MLLRFLILVFLAMPLSAAAVDLIWWSGVETGDFAEFGTTNASVNATRVRTGNYSVENTGNAETPNLGNMSEVWMRCYFNVDSYPPSALVTAVKMRATPAGSNISVLSANTDSTLDLAGTTGTATLSSDTWHLIEMHYKKGTGANAEHHLWVDGTIDITITNSSETADIQAIDFEQFSDSLNTFLDDCAISTVGRIFGGEIVALRPNADASPDLFVGEGLETTTWDRVDDDPVVDSTLARAPVSGGPPVGQEWDLTTKTSVGTINAVRVIARAKKGTGGGSSETIRPDGTNDIVGYTTCTAAEIDDDPDTDDGEWCDGVGTDVATEVDAEMANPTGGPDSATNAQEVRVCLRSTGQSSDPTCSVDILEGNIVRVNNVISKTISQTDCTTVDSATWTFDPAVWTDDTGAAIEVGVDCTPGSGNPANRASGELGAVELNLTLKSATTHKLIANNDNDSQLSLSGDLGLTSTLAYYFHKATGLVVPTSQDDLDAYEIGGEQSVAGDPRMEITDIFLMVDHDAVSSAGKLFIITTN